MKVKIKRRENYKVTLKLTREEAIELSGILRRSVGIISTPLTQSQEIARELGKALYEASL